MQGFQPQPDGDFGQQGFQYQDRQQMGEPAPGPSGAQPPCPMPNKTTKLVALQCPEVSETVGSTSVVSTITSLEIFDYRLRLTGAISSRY